MYAAENASPATIGRRGLVAGLVTGTEKTKYEVTTGEYNEALDTKIAQIKAACPGGPSRLGSQSAPF